MRFFNTAGPVNCDDHYCLPPLSRFDLDEILMLLDQKKYFVLHAPRQTGKTSCLLALADYLNQRGKYRCLYINVEPAQAARENVREGMRAIVDDLASGMRHSLKDDSLDRNRKRILEEAGPFKAFHNALSLWAESSNVPAVLFIDEVDSLVGDTLISMLRQLRAGYTKRPGLFPQSIILCGVRDVRDYRIHSSNEKAIITGGSAFNVKAVSLRLGDFSWDEVETLFKSRADETGQRFDSEAMKLIWEYSEGQPWLVNAMGYETCFNIKENRDRSITITGEMVRRAKENIIMRRETHIDQLADKLSEERVERVIEPILAGQTEPEFLSEDDVGYVRDLGLIKIEGNLRIANRLYQEVIPPRAYIRHTVDHQSPNPMVCAERGRETGHGPSDSGFPGFFPPGESVFNYTRPGITPGRGLTNVRQWRIFAYGYH